MYAIRSYYGVGNVPPDLVEQRAVAQHGQRQAQDKGGQKRPDQSYLRQSPFQQHLYVPVPFPQRLDLPGPEVGIVLVV